MTRRVFSVLVATFLAMPVVLIPREAVAADLLSAGPVFRVDSTARLPAVGDRNVARLAGGRYVVVWEDVPDYSYDVFARLVDPDGSLPGAEFRVNAGTGTDHGADGDVKVAAGPDGGFVIVWRRNNQLDHPNGVLAQRYDADANPQASQFRVDTPGTSPRYVDIAYSGTGPFSVAWTDQAGAPTWNIVTRTYDSDGTALTGEVVLTPGNDGESNQLLALGGAPDGSFAALWRVTNAGSPYPLYLQRYDASGTLLGSRQLIAGVTSSDAALAHGPSGDFVVAWRVNSTQSAFQRYDSDGTAIGTAGLAPISQVSDLDILPDGRIVFEGNGYVYRILPSGVAEHAPVRVSREWFIAPGGIGVSPEGNVLGAFVRSHEGVYARRLCDELDASCDRCPGGVDLGDDDLDTVLNDCDLCPGFDDREDADVDGVPDGCDRCIAGAGGTGSAGKEKLRLKRVDSTSLPGNAKLTWRLNMTLPLGFTLEDADPVANGLTFSLRRSDPTPIVTTADLTPVIDVTIPGGEGWKASRSGKRFKFRGSGLPPISLGKTKVILLDKRKDSDRGPIRLKIKSLLDEWPTVPPDELPFRASIGVIPNLTGGCVEISSSEFGRYCYFHHNGKLYWCFN
jgi:hypothetical protein